VDELQFDSLSRCFGPYQKPGQLQSDPQRLLQARSFDDPVLSFCFSVIFELKSTSDFFLVKSKSL
jgi:hypothetical protein